MSTAGMDQATITSTTSNTSNNTTIAVVPVPVLNVPGEVSFSFQSGLIKDSVSIETSDLNLKSLKDLACNFVDKKVSKHYSLIAC